MCLEKAGEHWISSTKLLKVAQLYPAYCTVVLTAFIVLENLLIKKVFPLIILNNNKYSGHRTLSWFFFSPIILEIESISVITYKVFNLSRVLLLLLLLFSTYALQPSRLIVRSGLDVPTFTTRCLPATAPSGGRWNCGQEMSGNFA